MAAISSNLVLTLVTTYLLLLILFAILILRYISLRRARTTYRPFSLRGISGFLIWASGFLTLIYAILGTWWWIAAEKYALAYLNSISDIHFSSIPPSAGGSDSSAAAAKTVDRLFDPPRKELETRLGAETGLSMLYIFIMWAVKAVFLLLIREAWGKLGKATKVVWWVTAVNAALCWFVLVIGTVTVIGVNLTKGSIQEALEFMTEAMVLNIGLAHIQSLVLVLLTCALALRELSPYFPLAIPPRHTAILFAFAVLSILFTSLRLAAASSPYPRESFIHILTIGELFLLVSITALPSTALARASSLHGNLLRIPSPTDPGYTHHHHRNSHSPSRNHKNLRVSTHETKVTASDFGYTVTVMGQGDNGQPIPSAPLFVPEKVQLRPGWDEKVDFGAAGYVSSSEEDASSSDEELGRGKWKGGRASARVSGLRSGFEEGRDWRRSVGGDEIRTPRSARTRFGGTTPRTPRTPRGFV